MIDSPLLCVIAGTYPILTIELHRSNPRICLIEQETRHSDYILKREPDYSANNVFPCSLLVRTQPKAQNEGIHDAKPETRGCSVGEETGNNHAPI